MRTLAPRSTPSPEGRISDQTMPGMTGIEFARAMRVIRAALPIVLYTGYDEGLAPATIERAGVVALVRKPIEPHLLVAVLEKYLRRPMPPQSRPRRPCGSALATI